MSNPIDAWESKVPEGESGNAKIQKFSVDEHGAAMHNMRCPPGHYILPGDYTRLLLDGKTMMSDTVKERLDHMLLFDVAQGDVIVHGLGLGCAASVLCELQGVNTVTVIEINEHVIKLVKPTLQPYIDAGKLRIIHGDAFTWVPPKPVDTVFSDVWLEINDDNLPEMDTLKSNYSDLCGLHLCWSEAELRQPLTGLAFASDWA